MKKYLHLILCSFATINLLMVGYSIWFIQSNTIDANFSYNLRSGKVIFDETNLLTPIATEHIVLCKDGLIYDGQIANEVALDYSFNFNIVDALNFGMLNNNEIKYDISFLDANNTGLLNTALKSANFKWNEETTLTNLVGNVSKDGNTNFDCFKSTLTLNVDPSLTSKDFTLKFIFQGNFYNEITNDANFELTLKYKI